MTTINDKINTIVFKEILLFVSYKCNFKKILDYALLSKSCFIIFQKIILNNSVGCKIVFEAIEFTNYLSNSIDKINSLKNNSNNNKNIVETKRYYNRKLIQYKSIENLYLDKDINFINNSYYNDSTTKEIILENCKKLKRLIFNSKCDAIYSFEKIVNNNNNNNNRNNNIKLCFNQLNLNWYYFNNPTSYEDEETILKDFYSMEELSEFSYSYDFLLKYNDIKKIIISSNLVPDHIYQINNYNNFFKHSTLSSTLRSIEFEFHNTPISFLKSLINEMEMKMKTSIINNHCYEKIHYNIKNLTIRIDDHYTSEININEYFRQLQSLLFLESKKLSKSLRKLIIKQSTLHKRVDSTNQIIGNFLKELVGSDFKLHTLGLQVFDICDYNQLELLFKLNTLKSLQCNLVNTGTFLQHISKGIINNLISNDFKNLVIDSSENLYQYKPINFVELLYNPIQHFLNSNNYNNNNNNNNNCGSNIKLIIHYNNKSNIINYQDLLKVKQLNENNIVLKLKD